MPVSPLPTAILAHLIAIKNVPLPPPRSIPRLKMSQHINYAALSVLCHIRGLHRRDSCSIQSAHDTFMKQYPKIFLHEKPRRHKILQEEVNSKKTKETKVLPDDSHDIAIHVKKARGGYSFYRKDDDTTENLTEFMAIVKKLPICRTTHEHNIVWKILSKIPELTSQLSDEHLKMLSKNVFSETWVQGSTVVGNDGLYIILKGLARPHTKLSRSPVDNDSVTSSVHRGSVVFDVELTDFRRSDVYIPAQESMLTQWSTFGSLEVTSESELGMPPRSIFTEEDCEILKIPAKEYTKLKLEKVKLENIQKFKLFRKCRYYEEWPTLSIQELIPICKWKKFPAGHVLVETGNIISFVGFINSGYCKIYRNIMGLIRLPLNKVKKVKKLVYMGRLKEKESFGEISVLLQVPFTCTIITGTEVEMAIIEDKDLFGLDEVTKQLMIFTTKPTFGHLTDEDVKQEYIAKSQQKEWNNFKDKTIKKLLFHNGIIPGFGKWTHYWTSVPRNLKDPLIVY